MGITSGVDLTHSLKPVLPPDVERRLNEPPPRAISAFLAEPYPLDREQVEQYREHGFVKLEQVISGEPVAAGSRRGGDPEFVDIFIVTEDIAPPASCRGSGCRSPPADCTFHSGCVYHRADANRTSAMREAMAVAYMSAAATYDWPDWNTRVQDTHGFATDGLLRGDPVNKPTTP